MSKSTKIISTTIDTESKAKLEAFANERGMKKSQVIRTVIDSVVKGERLSRVRFHHYISEFLTSVSGITEAKDIRASAVLPSFKCNNPLVMFLIRL